MATREQIYAAFFALLEGLNPTTATPAGNGTLAVPATRIFRQFSQVPIQPWLGMLEDEEDVSYPLMSGPSKRLMSASVILYAKHTDHTVAGGTVLNNLTDAVENIVRPDTAVKKEQTLGGLVTWVRFKGATKLYVGDLLQQSIVTMTFEILATV